MKAVSGAAVREGCSQECDRDRNASRSGRQRQALVGWPCEVGEGRAHCASELVQSCVSATRFALVLRMVYI